MDTRYRGTTWIFLFRYTVTVPYQRGTAGKEAVPILRGGAALHETWLRTWMLIRCIAKIVEMVVSASSRSRADPVDRIR